MRDCTMPALPLVPKRTFEFAIVGALRFALKLPEGWRATEVERRKL